MGLILVFVFLIMAMGIWMISNKRIMEVGPKKISVVTSFYPLYFLASEIGKEKIAVTNITPVGIEPHDYEPTARDMAEIHKARILILNGGGFESWSGKIQNDINNVFVLEAAKGQTVGNDVHVWLSPELAKKESEAILAGLIQIDPANRDYYTDNALTLEGKLNKLMEDYKRGLASCQSRKIITSHAAFGYLTREFGLTQVAISGISPDEEPSTKQLAEVTRVAREDKVKYIFFERLVSPKLAEVIAEEVGVETLVLDPIEGISDNDMERGANYLTIMEENLANLRIALECL